MSYGFSIGDCMMWDPRWGVVRQRRTIYGSTQFDFDLVGFFYFPLISIDRTIWHKTVYFLDDNGKMINQDELRNIKLHPRERQSE
jgi:hypothetical protein